MARLTTRDILGEHLADTLDSLCAAREWAEEEIEKARAGVATAELERRLWHSIGLLKPAMPMTEIAYRAHCRELLARVVAGEDTRPGTAAECCVALCEMSLKVPLNTPAAGLYARMWVRAGLPPSGLDDRGEHYEALEGQAIDDLEQLLVTALRQPDRQLPNPIQHRADARQPTPRVPGNARLRRPRPRGEGRARDDHQSHHGGADHRPGGDIRSGSAAGLAAHRHVTRRR